MEEIIVKAVAIAREQGSLGEATEGRLTRLAQVAAEGFLARLRPGVTLADCGGALALAAGWTALADYQMGGGEEVESFTAGDVTVRQSGGGTAQGEALRRRAQKVMAPYARGEEPFAFQGVRG